ncbi:hypothetical protein [Hydrotalea sandarakina]|jgi:hypothetical protein|uniref:hypothetical protein n=1 Tax=Hydrotalea sandarakina TaxID=1004304 RepID=UPI0011B5EF35|nr:hypothetical protein [Hydrotalea sandarakina]
MNIRTLESIMDVLLEYPSIAISFEKWTLLVMQWIRYCFETASSQQRCVTLLIGKCMGEGWVMVGEC